MMKAMLEPHIVTLTSPRERDGHDFFVDRERGLCAFAVGRHDDDEDGRCGAGAGAIIDKLAFGCGQCCAAERVPDAIAAAREQLSSGRVDLVDCERPRASVAAI